MRCSGNQLANRVNVRYIVRRFTTGSPIDGTHWLPNKEITKLWEVSDETSTDRFPHFQCLTLQGVTRRLSVFGQGVDLGGQPSRSG